VIEHFRGQFSRKVLEPALKELSKDNYPLKKDKVGKRDFYQVIVDAPEPDESGADDVPF
jgi:hypothetical protein